MRNMYWRARRRSTIWDVFQLLVNEGLVDPKSLTVPIDLNSNSDSFSYVYAFLNEFSCVDRDDSLVRTLEITLQSYDYDIDIRWCGKTACFGRLLWANSMRSGSQL